MKQYQLYVAICVIVICSCKSTSGGHASSVLDAHRRAISVVNEIIYQAVSENKETASIAANVIASVSGNSVYHTSIYYKDKTGVLADHQHKADSNIYIPANMPITNQTWAIIRKTEILEQRWKKVETKMPVIGWQYITHGDTKISRTYPWLDEVRNVGSTIDYTKAPQWLMIDPANNPERYSKCTHAYFDHDGLGDMITCAAPIYIANNFVGNMSIDLPIPNYFRPLLDEFNARSDVCMILLDRRDKVMLSTEMSTSVPLCLRAEHGKKLPDELKCDIGEALDASCVKGDVKIYESKIKYVGGTLLTIEEV